MQRALHGYRGLIWLKLRHARTKMSLVMHIAGTDINRESDTSDRIYQLYVLIAAGVAAVLVWLGLLNIASNICEGLHPFDFVLFLSPILAVGGILLVFFFLRFLRASPLKLSYPDIAYVIASPLKITAVTQINLLVNLLFHFMVGCIVGSILGAGAHSSLDQQFDVAHVALVSALLFVCFDLVAWSIGFLRLDLGAHAQTVFNTVTFFIFGLMGVVCAFLLLQEPIAASSLLLHFIFMFTPIPAQIACLVGCILLGILVVTLFARKVNTATIAEENTLYAQLYPLRHLQLYGINSYRELRRQKLLALRRPVAALPQLRGRGALLSRALLSHVRQPVGIVKLLFMGAVLVPAGVVMLLDSSNLILASTKVAAFLDPHQLLAYPLYAVEMLSGYHRLILYCAWALALVFLPLGRRELSRVFRDDQRNRLIRNQIPYSTLSLLLVDSLPAYVLTCLTSATVLFFLIPFGDTFIAACLLILLINGALVICAGLDSVRLSWRRYRLNYELGLAAIILVMGAMSFTALPLLMIPAVAVLELLCLLLIRKGFE